MTIEGAPRDAQGLRIARLDVHQHVDRLVERLEVERLVVEIPDRRIGEAVGLQLGLRRGKLIRPETSDPGREDEIGLEGIDRRAQRLQHVGLHHRRRPEQPRGHPRQQLALGQAVLHQAGMDVDRPRQRDTVDRELLIVHSIGGKTGEQNSDQSNQCNDEAQSNHTLTRQSGGGERGR